MIGEAARCFDRAPRGDVAVLMSGGADSTLAAAIASRTGRRCVGVTMRHTEGTEPSLCASAACAELGMEWAEIDVRDAFERYVASPFREEYASGRTPNPCAACNRYVKFGALIDAASRDLGLDGPIVTGHYARVLRSQHGAVIARAADRSKDQSYFLCTVPRGVVPRLVLPLGAYSKASVRDALRSIARPDGALMRAADAPDSMDSCFASGDAARSRAPRAGDIVSPDGRVLGRHDGIERFTIGQRKGIGVSSSERLFVVRIDAETATVTVAPRDAAFASEVTAGSCEVFMMDAVREGARLFGRIRSQGEPSACTVARVGDRVSVVFDEPVFAPTPGQYLALYDGEALVLGGVITSHLQEV